MKISLRAKLVSIILVAAIVPICIVATIAFIKSKNSLEHGFIAQLSSINSIKKSQIDSFFHERRGDVDVLSGTPYVIDYMKSLHKVMALAKDKRVIGRDLLRFAEYRDLHTRYHTKLDKYMKAYGYYDIFLISHKDGHIFYSTAKEDDFNTLVTSSNSGLHKAWKKAVEDNKIVLTDTEAYAPSNGDPAQFIASPVRENGKIIGILAFQIPLDPINRIMGNRDGMGKSGESYLVGQDQLMRSDSYLDPQYHSVIGSFKNPSKGRVNTEASIDALGGQKGAKVIIDYNGNPVLSSFDSLDLGDGIVWAILSEIDESEAFASVKSLLENVVIVLVVTAAIFSMLGIFFGRSIANPILKLSGMLRDSSNQVSSASEQLSSSSQELSSASAQQASSIEETSASLEEITGMVNNNVENAKRCVEISQSVSNSSQKGNSSMQDLIESMQNILESNEKIQQLVKVIDEIGEKTAIIDEIVFQTKLLSFNASVEAERAGEHGRGFAVVAQEVGNLAQMSGKAAAEISTIVKESIKNAEEITTENKQKVEAGNEIVKSSAETLREISEQSNVLFESITNILNASEDQAGGITQINGAVTQLDKATQENAATAEETASSSEELSAQAQNLDGMVRELTSIVTGKVENDGTHSIANVELVNPRHKAEVVHLQRERKIEEISRHIPGNEAQDEWEAI